MSEVRGVLSPEEKRKLLAEKLRERAERTSSELFLTAGQKALFFIHRLQPQSPAYHVIFAARVISSVDESALRAAFQALIDRHEALRSFFPIEDGEPVLRVLEKLEAPFQTIDASDLDDRSAIDALRKDAETPFDLEHGPVLRVRLYRRSAGDSFLAAVFHHIAIDGWSLWICLSELSRLYQAARAGVACDLPPVTRTFRDYSRWQREMIESAEGRRLQRFWENQLGRDVPVLNLPTDYVRPALPRYRGASIRFALDSSLSESLKALSRREGATLQMALLALFEILLYRYTTQEDFPIGTLASGRSRVEDEDVVGYLANPLVLRTRVSPAWSFRELLRKTRETMLDAFEHQDYPFPLLVSSLDPNREPSRTPLFQVLYVFEKAQRLEGEGANSFILGEPGARMSLGELVLEPLPFTAQHEGQFDLILLAAELSGRVSGYFDFNTDLFAPETIERLASHFVELASSAAKDPDAPVAKLPMLTAAELEALDGWNRTEVDCEALRLHELFERQVRDRGDALAAAFEGAELSYRELDERSSRLARILGELGVAPGERVGLEVERSLDLVVGILGVGKAGAAFVPLDPAYPSDRLQFMIEDSGLSVLLTQRALADRLPPFGGRVVYLDDQESFERPLEGRLPAGGPDDVAYVIYTSGSTGRPKGVLVPHRGLATLAFEQQRQFGVGPGFRVLQFSALSFDAAIFETVMALASGGSLHLARLSSLLPGPPLFETLKREAIHVVTLPPSALAHLPEGCEDELSDLKVVTVAGEPCPSEVVERWAPRRRFFNLYGPTESTIWATFCECFAGSDSAPPIGKPIANTRTHVLDRHLELVPIGVPGELGISGIGLADGYLGRAELSAEKFVRDPFRHDGARLYRTGDLVRRRSDGNIEFLGRLDFQVKVRGFRIELGEIEAVLGAHPEVKEAVATVREDSPGNRRVVAYVIPRDSVLLETADLKSHLEKRLPAFMVPSVFEVLPSFPRLPNGKIDRSALPRPSERRSEGATASGPESELEKTISSVWKSALSIDSVNVQDNFFDIGGNSLLIAKVAARLESALERKVPILDLFQHPTVRALAKHLSAPDERDRGDDRSRADARKAGRDRLELQRSRRARGRDARTSE